MSVAKRYAMPLGRQGEVLVFIRNYHADYGYAPSMADVAKALGITAVAARLKRDRLADKGYLAYHSRIARSTVVTQKGLSYISESAL